MKHKHINKNDPKTQKILEELKAMITKHFPNTQFEVSEGGDTEGVYLEAIADMDDPDPIMDIVIDRLYELQVEQGLPIHVLALRTPERNAKLWREQHQKQHLAMI